MNSTKILIVTSEFPPQPGGIGNHAYHLGMTLVQKGYEVTIHTNSRSKTGEEELSFDRKLPLTVIRVPRYSLNLRTYLERIKTVQSAMRSNDIIIASGKFSLWLIGMFSFLFRRKSLAVLHGSELRLSQKILRSFTLFCLKRFDRLIAVSKYTQQMLPETIRQKIAVVPNGFDINTEFKQVIPNFTPDLITVGNLTQRKGQHNVVAALPMLKEHFSNISYILVGIPTEKDKIETQARALKVIDHIQIKGKVSETKKIKLLQKASLFVMLSETTASGDVEGFGIAILEANALGLPAIGAINCGIEDAIDHGRSGLLIDPHQPEQLLEAIRTIGSDYQRFSANAIGWSQQFTWDKIVLHYVQIIDSL